jgi:hypothetical protein
MQRWVEGISELDAQINLARQIAAHIDLEQPCAGKVLPLIATL